MTRRTPTLPGIGAVAPIEIVGPLGGVLLGDRWLVRDHGEVRVAWVLHGGREACDRAERRIAPWLGFAHPRAVPVHRTYRRGDALIAVAGDDRGPRFPDAAARLADGPELRERWAVAQIIGVCDALDEELRAHAVPRQRLHEEWLFVAATGKVRLRPRIEAEPIVYDMEEVVDERRMLAAYMCPAHAEGRPVGAEGLVFTLAAYLAHALDRPPFADESPLKELMRVHRRERHPTRTHAPGLEEVLARAFAQQYPSPAAFGAELRACVPDADEVDAVVSDRIAAWWPTAPHALDDDAPRVFP